MKRLEPGAELDGFTLTDLLHSGGMAHIYSVTGRETGFPLAMKVPRMSQSDGAETLVSFEVEKTLMSALSGPHVPRLVAVGDMAATPYLVMEWVEGRCLDNWLEGDRPDAAEIARLGAALATAAHSMHMQHAVHLDIKPANVMIRPDGTAVLIDFGLSHHDHYPDLLAEEMRPAVGSAPYIAPEQVTGVRNEPRSDIFAIGVTLYELATRELPFGAPGTRMGMRKRLWSDPLPPRALNPDVPPWLQEVILRCLEARPDRRYPSAAQLAFDLAHPDQVALTERAERLARRPWRRRFAAWLKASGWEHKPQRKPTELASEAPIILVAVSTVKAHDLVVAALRTATQQALRANPTARLTCVTVIPPTPLQTGGKDELSETSIHRRHLVALRQWAEPMRLAPERLSLHVIEAGDRGRALIEYAEGNHVSLIIMGAPKKAAGVAARQPAPLRVAQEASCSVQLIRPSAAAVAAAARAADTDAKVS